MMQKAKLRSFFHVRIPMLTFDKSLEMSKPVKISGWVLGGFQVSKTLPFWVLFHRELVFGN